MKKQNSQSFQRSIFGIFSFLLISASTYAAEVQIFSNEQRVENANTMILDNDDTTGDVTLQFGAALNETFGWNEANTRFELSDNLHITGTIETTGDATIGGNIDAAGTIQAGSGNITLTDATGNILGDTIVDGSIDETEIDFGTGAGQVGGADIVVNDTFDNSAGTEVQTVLDDVDAAVGIRSAYTAENYIANNESVAASVDALDVQLKTTTDNIAGATGTTSNTYTLDNDDTTGDVTLIFGAALNETFGWNEANTRFELSDRLHVTGTIESTGNATIGGTITAGSGSTVITTAAGKLDGSALEVDTVDDTAIDFGTGAGQVGGADIVVNDTFDNSAGTEVQTVLDDVDAAVGDIAAYSSTDVVANADSTVTAIGKIDAAVGLQTYTEDNFVTDGEDITASIDALDQALGGTESLHISMNDLTVSADGSNNLVDLYTDSDATHQYYIMKTQNATQQDLDVVFKVKLPQNFDSFPVGANNDISFFYKTTNTTTGDNQMSISVTDTGGDEGLDSGTPVSALNSATWTEHTNDFDGGSFNPAAGEYVYVTISGFTRNNSGTIYSPYIGEIVIDYVAKGVGI